MNLAGLRERTRELSGIRTEELAPDGRLDAMLDEAHRELCGQADWPFLYTEAGVVADAGVATVELPVELRRITAVSWDGGRLRSVVVSDIDQLGGQDGDPQVWARVDAERLLLWPTPERQGSVAVRGYRHPPRLAADNDTPAFETEFHMALAYAAASRLLVQEGDDSGRADFYLQEWGDAAQSMRIRYLRADDTSPFQRGGRIDRRRRWRL